MRAAIYGRKSTQDDENVQVQLKLCRDFAASKGWAVVQEFSDDGISGREFVHRPGFTAMLADAKKRRQVLRYVGRIDAVGKATVGLTHLDATHAFANIALTDNVVRFATRRYCDNPLIVQGPGAGPEVTAGGVFADLLRLSAYLGAHL